MAVYVANNKVVLHRDDQLNQAPLQQGGRRYMSQAPPPAHPEAANSHNETLKPKTLVWFEKHALKAPIWLLSTE